MVSCDGFTSEQKIGVYRSAKRFGQGEKFIYRMINCNIIANADCGMSSRDEFGGNCCQY